MRSFLQAVQSVRLGHLRRLAVVFVAGVLLMATTACSQPDITAGQSVPEATAADVNRAQSNLSDDAAVNEDILANQGKSRARQTDGATVPQS